jgi:carbonic anhydrase/acetyltransferase-like protein (isoleucine patch superfamily)
MRPAWLPPVEQDLPIPIPTNVEVGADAQVWSALAFLHYRSERPLGLRIGRRSVLWGVTMLDLGPQAELWVGDCSGMLEVTVTTNGSVRIGDFALIGHHVVIAGDPIALPPAAPADSAPVPEPIDIGDSVFIAANSIILAGARIGDGAVVGAGTIVDGEVPAGATAYGNPYRVIRRPPAPRVH